MAELLDLDWKSEYDLGVPELDVQHRYFLKLIREIRFCENTERLALLLEEIYNAVVTHMKYEKFFMEMYSFSDTKQHVLDHSHWIDELAGLAKKTKEGHLTQIQLAWQLIRWLVKHTTFDDKELGEHVVKMRKKIGTYS